MDRGIVVRTSNERVDAAGHFACTSRGGRAVKGSVRAIAAFNEVITGSAKEDVVDARASVERVPVISLLRGYEFRVEVLKHGESS